MSTNQVWHPNPYSTNYKRHTQAEHTKACRKIIKLKTTLLCLLLKSKINFKNIILIDKTVQFYKVNLNFEPTELKNGVKPKHQTFTQIEVFQSICL